ncbi:MAG: hypothetical protein ACRD1T_18520, partial [Acidimicrobiia bacterium]
MTDEPPWVIKNRQVLDDFLSREQDPQAKQQLQLWFAAFEANPYSVEGMPVPGQPGWLWNRIEIEGSQGEKTGQVVGFLWYPNEETREITV